MDGVVCVVAIFFAVGLCVPVFRFLYKVSLLIIVMRCHHFVLRIVCSTASVEYFS